MGKRKTHAVEDQYGEVRGQDHDFQPPAQGRGPGGGMRGGGSGGGRRQGGNVSFQRHVPKFLQAYSHLLGKPQPRDDDDEPLAEEDEDPSEQQQQQRRRQQHHGSDDDDAADDDGDAEAIQRALEENPELAAEVGDRYIKKLQAREEKEKGNKAFADKKYEAAVTHFSRCIELDPRDEVYFSNRSAAYAALGKYEEALGDAQAVLRLKPAWVKGHARLAAALYGLEAYEEAKEAYEKALKVEPNDQTLQRGYERAMAMELKHIREKKHVFKKARTTEGSKKSGGSKKGGAGSEAKGKKVALSFADEEEEDGGNA